jgi:hypothetical protein
MPVEAPSINTKTWKGNYTIALQLFISTNNALENNTHLRQNKSPKYLPAFKRTQHKVHNIRIRDEVKYLYIKKQHLKQQIYHLHLTLANAWNNTWLYQSIFYNQLDAHMFYFVI